MNFKTFFRKMFNLVKKGADLCAKEEYAANIEARRDALYLRFAIVAASNVAPRVKAARFNAITQEVIALKIEIEGFMTAIAKERGNG